MMVNSSSGLFKLIYSINIRSEEEMDKEKKLKNYGRNSTVMNISVKGVNRRDFLKKGSFLIGAGFALPTLSSLMMSCETDELLPSPPPSLAVRLSDYPELLKTDGSGIAKVTDKTSSTSVIVRRLTTDEFIIVQSSCTHQSAELNLPISKDGNIVCPLHNAEFSLQKDNKGQLVKNPQSVSASNLRVYNYTYNNGILTIYF
jgi:nitrite reductase/ring-hydroxylating ferredoxin subunit